MRLKRICIYPKDVQRITGKSERSGRRLLQKLRIKLGKTEEQLITVEDFAKYTGINAEIVQEFLID